MKRKNSMAATSRMAVLLTFSLLGCGEKLPAAPEPSVAQPVVPVAAQPTAAPVTSGDSDLESRLKKLLAGDPAHGASAVEVRVVDGVVRLWGTVRTNADKRKIVALVKAVDRVVSVESNLVVVAGS